MSNYWEEQQLKQMGMSSMIEQSETKPDRTRKVPHMLKVKHAIDRISVHEANKDLFSNTIIL